MLEEDGGRGPGMTVGLVRWQQINVGVDLKGLMIELILQRRISYHRTSRALKRPRTQGGCGGGNTR